MEINMTSGEQNLLFLQNMIPDSDSFYIWCYDSSGEFVASSCPLQMQPVLEKVFRDYGGMEQLSAYAADRNATVPKIIGSPIGMQWALSYEAERRGELIFVIGPVFYSRPSEAQLRSGAPSFSKEWIDDLCSILNELPVIPYAIFIRYVLLVHNTLSGQQLTLDALESRSEFRTLPVKKDSRRDRQHVYQAEKTMLAMVRHGDISYSEALQDSISLSPGVPVQGQDPLRQMKTSIIVFTTLVCRAAMEGGLDPETAYSLGDSYIQSAEDCRDSGELDAMAHAMYHDFIYRVHLLHSNPDYSHPVQKCIDYINLSVTRKIRIADLAVLVGYTEYYLSEKFRQETGIPLKRYIRDVKIARAKLLLETTGLSVREIAYRLAFNTPNYFIQCFRESTGHTPAQYRHMHQTE